MIYGSMRLYKGLGIALGLARSDKVVAFPKLHPVSIKPPVFLSEPSLGVFLVSMKCPRNEAS